jgi:hypothetical protein
MSIYANVTHNNLGSLWFCTKVIYTYATLPKSVNIITPFTESSYFIPRLGNATTVAALEEIAPAIPLSPEPYTTELVDLQMKYTPEIFI